MHQIRYFLAVAETRSFTRAAERCAISQPALTSAIKKLEEELGGPLILRERGGAKLTTLGMHVLPRFQRLWDENAAITVIAENHKRLKQVPVRVGILASIGPGCLASYLAAFRRAAPGVELEIQVGTHAELHHKLEDAQVDLLISNLGETYPDWFVTAPLYQEKYMVVLPPDHRLGAKDGLSLSDLIHEPYIDRLACEMREQVFGVCSQRDIEFYAAYRTEREEWIQALVQAGVGFAFMPEYSVLVQETVVRPLIDPPLRRTISLARSGDRSHTPATKIFWDTLLRRAATLRYPTETKTAV